MNDINDIAAEAAVLASIIQNPDLYFADTALDPKHFFEEQNRFLYYALGQLIKRGSTIDAFNIMQVLSQNAGTKKRADEILSIAAVNEFINNSSTIARRNVEDYKLASGAIIEKALKREMYTELTVMQNMCLSDQYQEDFEQEVYAKLDGIIKDYTVNSDIVELKDNIDEIWDNIQARKRGDVKPIAFPWPTLSKWVLMEPSTLTVLSGSKKSGKSMAMLTVAIDLARQGLSTLIVDSEISDELWVKRALSHITKIPFAKLKYATYTEEEEQQLIEAKEWLKTRKIVHKYMPILDSNSLSLMVKRAMYVMDGFDVMILDYLKADSRSDDAYANYSALGRLCDQAKEIAGSLKIPILAAAQSTEQGTRVADSAKIARNADAVVLILPKTPEEIERDGPECGNKKFFVYANRNGPQMLSPDTEYISMNLEGNVCAYTEPKQHEVIVPY